MGAVVYAFVGNQYMTAPAFGSLQPVFKKVAFSFMIPTLIFLGVLYASVSARLIFFRLFKDSRHKNEHTVVGWGSWAAILCKLPTVLSWPHNLGRALTSRYIVVTWALAFVVSQIIPFFSDRKYKTNWAPSPPPGRRASGY